MTATAVATSHQSRSMGSDYRSISIDRLLPSKTNPRKHFAKASMEELIDSVKQMGVLEPLLVRAIPCETPSSCRFEIVSGERRYRASKAAGLAAAPCRVMVLTDEEVLEIHMVENMQRQDLHELEEAEGFHALMAAPYRQSAKAIADKIGKSEKYVHDRRKLLDLSTDLRGVFLAREITAGHAIILARIPADKQELCLRTALFVPERTLFDPEADKDDDTTPEPQKLISVRELQAWVDEHVRFDRKQADPMLYPETAKVLDEATEQDAKVLPITYEYQVQDTVRDGSRIFGPRSWVRADGRHDSKACESSEMGLVVSGPRRGETFKVCRDKKTCLVHYGREIRDRAKREKAAAGGNPAKPSKIDRREAQREAEEAQREEERQRWAKASPALSQAIADRVKTMSTKADGFLADLLIDRIKGLSWSHRNKSANEVPRGTTAEDAIRHMAFILLRDEANNEYHGPRDFPKRAKALGIDLAKILKAHAHAQAPAAPAAAKPQTSAPTKKRPTGCIGQGKRA